MFSGNFKCILSYIYYFVCSFPTKQINKMATLDYLNWNTLGIYNFTVILWIIKLSSSQIETKRKLPFLENFTG